MEKIGFGGENAAENSDNDETCIHQNFNEGIFLDKVCISEFPQHCPGRTHRDGDLPPDARAKGFSKPRR